MREAINVSEKSLKCATCNDEALFYYMHEVFCADCNDECISRAKEEPTLTEQEEAYLRIVFSRTKSLDVRDLLNKNSMIKARRIVKK
jgi:hypothetical protein